MKRVSIAVLALVAAALVLVGCGGSSGASSTETTTTASSSKQGGPGGMFNISEEAKTCLKEKGVELPGFKGGEGGPPSTGEKPERGEMPGGGEGGPPGGGFGGAGSEEMKKAFEECGVEAPEFKGGPGGTGGKPNTNSAAFKKQVNEYVACVRENGYELGEPNFSGEGPVFEKAESESAESRRRALSARNCWAGRRARNRSPAEQAIFGLHELTSSWQGQLVQREVGPPTPARRGGGPSRRGRRRAGWRSGRSTRAGRAPRSRPSGAHGRRRARRARW
jgi:hypothetical protein